MFGAVYFGQPMFGGSIQQQAEADVTFVLTQFAPSKGEHTRSIETIGANVISIAARSADARSLATRSDQTI